MAPEASRAQAQATAVDARIAILIRCGGLITSVNDAKAMIAACDQAKVKLMIAYRLHYEPTTRRAIQLVRGGAPLALHPLIGGLPPEVAWRYLRTAVDAVIPAVAP